MKLTDLIGQNVESVSWNDLDLLRSHEPLIFTDRNSIDLIAEWAEHNKRKFKAVVGKYGFKRYAVFLVKKTKRKHPWHEPQRVSCDFLENQLFSYQGKGILTASEFTDKMKGLTGQTT